MFNEYSLLKGIKFYHFEYENVTDMSHMNKEREFLKILNIYYFNKNKYKIYLF